MQTFSKKMSTFCVLIGLLTVPLSFQTIAQTTLILVNSYDISGSVPEASGLAYDKVNDQLFSVSDQGNIYRLSTSGQLLASYSYSGDLEGVTMYDSPNTLLIAIEDTYRLVEYNYVTGTSSIHTMSYNNQGDTGSGIEGVTYDPSSGDIYFLNEKDPAALIVANSSFSVTNEYSLSFSDDLSASSYVEETGFLWLGSDEESTIYKCNTGSVVETISLTTQGTSGGSDLDKLEGMAIDHTNQLLYIVTDGGEKLYVYDINDGSQTENLSVSSIGSFAASGGSSSASISSNVSWTVTNNDSWITVSPTAGTDDGSTTITVTSNSLSSKRTGTVTVAGGALTETIAVTQAGVSSTGSNLALNKTVTATGNADGSNVVAKLVDDEDDGSVSRWSVSGFPQSAVIDLGTISELEGTELVCYNDRAYQYVIETSTDGSNYSQIVNRSSNTTAGTVASPITDNFSTTSARYIRIIVSGASSYSGSWVSLTELRVFGESGTSTTAVAGVSLSPSTLSLTQGGTQQLSASVSPSNADDQSVSYASSNASIASVTSSGLVTAQSVGAAVITVTTVDGGFTDTSAITVTAATTVVSNLALNKSVTVSDEQSTNPGINAVDEDVDSRWSAQNYPQFLVIDFGAIATISSTEVVCFSDRAYEYVIEASTDGSSYVQVVDRSGNTTAGTNNAPITDSFSNIDARYVRMTVSGAASYSGSWVSIDELRVLGYSSSSSRQVDDISLSEDVLDKTYFYPNPTANSISIKRVDDYHTLMIMDQTGRLLESEKIAGSDISIDLNRLSSGIYIFQLFGDTKTFTQRVVKQ